MASVSVRRRDGLKKDGTPSAEAASGRTGWQVLWRDLEGKQKRKSFRRKTDADRFAVELEADLNRGNYYDPSSARLTVGELAKTWLAGQVQLTPSTQERYAAVLRNQVLPTWEKVSVGRVRHGDVQAWVAELSASGLAPRSVQKAYVVLSRILALAVREHRISSNPALDVELPRAAQKAKTFLTAEQVADLADACEDAQVGGGLIVEVLAYTGLRFGELAALRVRDFLPLRRRLTIERSVTDVNGVMVFGETKTHQHRQVSIPRSLVDELAAHVQATGRRGDDLLFAAPNGGVIRLNNWRRRCFDPGVSAAGLGSLTPHDLRHAAASLAVAQGADVKAVQRMLGHASAAMTLDTYAVLFEDGLDSVADRMDEVRASARSGRKRAV